MRLLDRLVAMPQEQKAGGEMFPTISDGAAKLMFFFMLVGMGAVLVLSLWVIVWLFNHVRFV
jgi:flagellar biogenesis protein FliO